MLLLPEAIPETVIARFHSYIETNEWGCWIWTGARSRGQGNKKWYGTFSFRLGGKLYTYRAHSFSFALYKGPLPPGWHRDHRCREFGAPEDDSLCTCPCHLFAATPAVNNLRRWRKM